jgi:hypothetical protein
MRASRSFVLAFVAALVSVSAQNVFSDESPSAEPAEGPVIVADKTHIDFRVDKTLITRYLISPKVAKPYFWPVWAAPGLAVTRAWPMERDVKGEAKDHVHQKSVWFCHGDVIPEGLDFTKHFKNVAGVDFWSEGKGHGNIVCVRVGKPQMGKDRAAITTTNEWRTAEDQPVLYETRTIELFPLGPGRNLLVLDIDLHASAWPITFADTKEGSLGVRVRESIRVDRGKGKLINAEGKSGEGKTVRGKGTNADRDGCWGLVSAWCDYSGPCNDDGTIAGIAVFADPTNPIDTAWHARNYGLLAANPFGRGKHAGFPDRKDNNDLVKLKKGEHLKLHYGLFVHVKDAKEADVVGAYGRFTKLKGK